MILSPDFYLGFFLNFTVALLVVRFIYYPITHNKPYVFTFLTFTSVIYFVLSFISSTEIGVGVGFGLFAIFQILRYRTDPIPIREMTYLFVIAGLPMMNSFGVNAGAWPELLFANLAVLLLLYVLEKEWGFHYEVVKQITYEKIELIRPENYTLLLADLKERTGLPITSIVVGEINFLKDTAEIQVYYDEPDLDWAGASAPETAYSPAGKYEKSTAI